MIKKYLRSIGYCIVVLGVIALSASLGNAQETTTQTPSYVALDNTNFISCSTGAYGSLYDALESTDTTIATLASGTAKTNLIKRVQYVEAWYYAKCAESRIVAGLMGSEGEVRDAFSWYQKAKTRAQALEVNANANDTLETLLGKIHGGIMYEVTVTPQNTIDTVTKSQRAFPVACPALPTYTEFLSGKDMMNTTVAMNPQDFDFAVTTDAVAFIDSEITASQHQRVTPQQDTCLFECKANATWDTVVVVKENGEKESVDACVGKIQPSSCGTLPSNASVAVGSTSTYEEQFDITTEQWEPRGRSQWTLQDTGDNSAGSCLYTCATGYHPYEGQCVSNQCLNGTKPASVTQTGGGYRVNPSPTNQEVVTGAQQSFAYSSNPTLGLCQWGCSSGYHKNPTANQCDSNLKVAACGGSMGKYGQACTGDAQYTQTWNASTNVYVTSRYSSWTKVSSCSSDTCEWTCSSTHPTFANGECWKVGISEPEVFVMTEYPAAHRRISATDSAALKKCQEIDSNYKEYYYTESSSVHTKLAYVGEYTGLWFTEDYAIYKAIANLWCR